MTKPTRNDYPRCRTCGHFSPNHFPPALGYCSLHMAVRPNYGCIDHTDLDAPDDPRQVTGYCEHNYPIYEDTDGND